MEDQLIKQIVISSEDATHVTINKFFESFSKIINEYSWEDKTEIIHEDFVDLIQNSKKNDLVLYTVSVGTLVQFCWNLIKDFNLFSEEMIPIYCSGHHYISKLKNHKNILEDLGYRLEGKMFKMNSDKFDKDKTTKYFIEALITYSELKELAELSRKKDNHNVEIEGLIKIRQKLYDEFKNRDDIISKCGICDNSIDLKNDEKCPGCDEPIVTMPNIRRHADYVNKKYKMEIEPLEEPAEKGDNEDYNQPKLEWICLVCTLKNDISSNNCMACGNVQ